MIVSIHQPNFFPHLPFFKKMQEADLFILLTHVQFEKGNYQNRFRMNDRWHTMSVDAGLDPISSKRYVNHEKDWNKIKVNVKYDLSEFDPCINQSLWLTNYNIIKLIKDKMNITTEVITDYYTNLTSTARLVHFCKTYKATQYLSGPSGKKYLDEKQFNDAGIEVVYQEPEESKPIIQYLYDTGRKG